MRRTTIVIAALVVLGATGALQALPIVGASANTLPAGAFMMDTYFLWRDFTREYNNSLYGTGDGGWIDLPEERGLAFIDLTPRLYYGATDWLTIRASLPLADRYVRNDQVEDTNTGLGDIVVDPKLRVYESEDRAVRLSLLTGVRFPTGDTDGTPPLSDGSTGYLAGAALTHPAGCMTVHWCGTYWLNGEKENGVDGTDLGIGLLSIENPVTTDWTLLLEFKGYMGFEDADFTRLYACPGAQWNGDRLTLGVSTMISVVGEGSTAVSTVDFDWAPYIRAYYRFF
ncbi:MAG: hypothetical protein GF405_00850 [Candidatus Eisenbacteria bacterium]|nr:hypothetical protein [Candidatus Eisenbacteria bacterium]